MIDPTRTRSKCSGTPGGVCRVRFSWSTSEILFS
uniref:Uncharacterized protein n=1 Tax=Meloidogyne javanica TaxID=6303 RepID=A0A915MXC7_MELJA